MSVDYGAFLDSILNASSATNSRSRNQFCPGANVVTMKRFPLFAALAFALPIAGLLATPAMAKPHKAKTHHVVKKAAAHKAPLKHKAKTSHAAVR
jgi:hypothetical protein